MGEWIAKYWLQALFGLATSILGAAYASLKKKYKEQKKESKAVKDGVVAMLHDRIIQSGMYFINKGEINITEFHNIEMMYQAYHNLGGNGTGTEIYERVKDLIIVK